MRNRFDHLGKQIGRKALGPSGVTLVHHEISPEVQYADLHHEPDPARAAERARLGLLGRIASGRCMIELYGHAPDGAELRACLNKHLTGWQQAARRVRAQRAHARRQRRRAARFVEPSLWILAAGTPETLVARLGLWQAPGWPRGVCAFGDDVRRVKLVAANELPRRRSTLLVRLMAGGDLLPQVIAELGKLPADAYEHIVADQDLLRLHHALAKEPEPRPQAQEIIVAMLDTWEKLRGPIWAQARRKGEKEGEKRGRAEALLTVLRARGIRVPREARARILAEQDPAQLERWIERACVATSLTAVLGRARRASPSRIGRAAPVSGR